MGAVINGTTTTSDVESGRGSKVPTIAGVLQVGDPGSPDVAVYIRLMRGQGVWPDGGGAGRGNTATTMAVAGLTRAEALDHIRAVQRALGIDPDALVTAIEQVEHASNEEPFPPTHESEEDLQEAFDALYEAATLSVGLKPASARAVQS